MVFVPLENVIVMVFPAAFDPASNVRIPRYGQAHPAVPGLFAIFEAISRWCVLRACGIKTKL